MDLGFLPQFPVALSYPLLFGLLLLAGMLGGEAARALGLPRIVGYVVVGGIIAPMIEALDLNPLVERARIFVDLALGLVLFDLGRRMNLDWMKRDWTLAASGAAESVLTFGAVFAALVALDFRVIDSAIAASIAIGTSPAVVLLIVQDTRSEGQVTERALNLVALNSLLASILSTILVASPDLFELRHVEETLLHPAYLFVGSLALGSAVASLARILARAVQKSPDLHFTLIAGLVVAAVGLATLLKVSVILALLAFGLFTRNDARRHDLLNVNLEPASRLLYIVLFVITGASLPLPALVTGAAGGIAIVAARLAAKLAGVMLFAPLGGLRVRQAVGLGCALMPMSTLALMLQHHVVQQYPAFGPELAASVLAAVIVMEIAGPIAVQWGLQLAGETEPEARPPTESPAKPGAPAKEA